MASLSESKQQFAPFNWLQNADPYSPQICEVTLDVAAGASLVLKAMEMSELGNIPGFNTTERGYLLRYVITSLDLLHSRAEELIYGANKAAAEAKKGRGGK